MVDGYSRIVGADARIDPYRTATVSYTHLPGLFICNLGTGHGYSVLDVIHAFSKACGKELPYVIDPRRPGDIAECWCDPSKAKRELGWEAQYLSLIHI